MCVIIVSFSQPDWVYGLKVYWKTPDCGNRMGYKKPLLPPKITAACTILNHTRINSISYFLSIGADGSFSSQNRSTTGTSLNTANVTPHGRPFGWQQWREDKSDSLDNSSWTAPGNVSRYGKHTMSISSAAWVSLPDFTAAISSHSSAWPEFYIQQDTQLATNHQCEPLISKLWATVGRIWLPLRSLWQVSNVPPCSEFRWEAVISWCTESATGTTGYQSSQFADIAQLQSSTWTSFWRTWQTLH